MIFIKFEGLHGSGVIVDMSRVVCIAPLLENSEKYREGYRSRMILQEASQHVDVVNDIDSVEKLIAEENFNA